MPISFLDDRNRINRVGRIRLGHKVQTQNGKERPVADPFFVLPDELKEFYGDRPVTLHIRFISDLVEHTFPHYLRMYSARGLRCLGDGARVIYQVDDKGTKTVDDCATLDADGHVIWERDEKTNMEHIKPTPCPGEDCPHYQGGLCKPTGYLRFVVEERLRQGYYDVVCHQRAVVGIRTQLELCLSMFGRLTDIPFLLHRGAPEKIPVKTAKGVVDMPIMTQWIEIEPEWFGKAFMQRKAVLQESREQLLLAAREAEDTLFPQVTEEDIDKSIREGKPGTSVKRDVAEFAEPAFEGENGETEPEYDIEAPAEVVESEESPEYEAVDVAAVRTRLLQHAAKFSKTAKVSEGQRGLLVGKLCEALQTKDEHIRHLVLKWIMGKESSRDLSYGEVGALLKWLVDGQDSTGDYPLKADGLKELLAIERVARVDAGQLAMAEVDA